MLHAVDVLSQYVRAFYFLTIKLLYIFGRGRHTCSYKRLHGLPLHTTDPHAQQQAHGRDVGKQVVRDARHCSPVRRAGSRADGLVFFLAISVLVSNLLLLSRVSLLGLLGRRRRGCLIVPVSNVQLQLSFRAVVIAKARFALAADTVWGRLALRPEVLVLHQTEVPGHAADAAVFGIVY
jgi:hypothetical protein